MILFAYFSTEIFKRDFDINFLIILSGICVKGLV